MAIAAASTSQPSPPARSPKQDDRLKDERNRFLAFAFAAADLLIEVDAHLHVTFAVGAAEGLLGRSIAGLIHVNFLDLFVEKDSSVIRAAVRRMHAKSRMEPIALRMVNPAGKEVRIALSGCRMPFANGMIHFAISALRPALAAETSEAETNSNLLSKEDFEASAQTLVAKPETLPKDTALNLIQVDGVENFRARNGQLAIDAMFGEIGAFLRAYAAGGLAGRIAPDRLAAISDASTEVDFTKEINDILRMHDPNGSDLRVKELAVALDVGELSPEDAAKALSYTLQEFANRDISKLPFKSLIESLRELMAKTAQRLMALKQAMTGNTGMKLVFQPVVSLAEREIHHYEVLTRFGDNKSPFETIEFAERVGMIEELDLTVCERALKYLDGAGADLTTSLAVNISGRSIQTDSFVTALDKMLKRYPTVRQRILFEITESTRIADLAQADVILQRFRRAGTKVCLDDFGAGAASFPYLRALHVDFIKIDGAYVKRMRDSERDQQLLAAMISMCQQMKTSTVAEMVETPQQAQSLLKLGVEFGQGYYFGKPADSPMELGPF
jgi:EAL domain-containing protein (putative c-di-GMP-specific phosphodiesterase class I)